MSGHLKVSVNPSASMEEKIEWLIKKYDELTDNVHTVSVAMHAKEEALSRRILDIEKGVDDKLHALQDQNADFHVGDVGKEIVGLFWIFFGITFATVPELIEFIFYWPIIGFQSVGSFIYEVF
tara:strand:- start:1873 stop:2241 length:369 start_codon:yes stop_codon:yes gene_type:complete